VPPPIRRSDADACPGALRLHAAADGPLARVRLPGGMLTGSQLAVLGELARRWGDGCLELTSRANVQLRALREADPEALAARLGAAGLLPSPAHELVRNIAAPPLAGAAVRALVHDLDRALCADPALAALPGRFLFAIGEVPLAADLAAVPATDIAGDPAAPAARAASVPAGDAVSATGAASLPSGDAFAILFAGADQGIRVPAGVVVPALIAAAHAFLAERAAHQPPAWRLRELPDGPARVAARAIADLPDISGSCVDFGSRGRAVEHEPGDPAGPPGTRGAGADGRGLVGRLAREDALEAAVGALVPLGRLTRVHLGVLARADRLVITPWRGVVVPDLSPEAADRWLRELSEAGLATEAGSRWAGVTACAGRPGCAKALADVRADAEAATRFVDGLPVHWIGCARGCGSPAGEHVRVEATPDGYEVSRAPNGGASVPVLGGDPRSAGEPAESPGGGSAEFPGARPAESPGARPASLAAGDERAGLERLGLERLGGVVAARRGHGV